MHENFNNADWYVYVVRCRDGSLYTGIAKSLEKRLTEHNTDNQLGAKYTRSRRPVKLVYQECCSSRSLAAQRESAIKRLSKLQKENLINPNNKPDHGSNTKNSTKNGAKFGIRPQNHVTVKPKS